MASEAFKEKTSSVLPQMTSSSGLPMSSPRQQSKSLLVAQATLRISAIVFTLIAISVIVTNTQSVIVFGFKFEAHYTYSTAFRFLVGANAVVCAFSALSLIFLSLFLSRSVPQQQRQFKNYFFLLVHDVVMMVLIISGCAAATAIGYVGRYGEKKMTWQPTCGYVSKYCDRMSISLAFSYLAFFAYLLLTFTSALTLMSRPTTQ
ncbi:PREDICTED: CASP-like protein 1F2 [Prunus mume]|uniref:CASP-like protein n=1 Tax=Prunus mume TaxID=102107 RepID=A0ABM0NWY5_PRUMU|nr:PREDICTED: CASP-like protein 1F2 [Prunus mume]